MITLMRNKLTMSNININDLQATELEKLDLLADSEGYLQELSEQEKINISGGLMCFGGYSHRTIYLPD
jgi:hypothetical protein